MSDYREFRTNKEWNSHPLVKKRTFLWDKNEGKVHLCIIQCKQDNYLQFYISTKKQKNSYGDKSLYSAEELLNNFYFEDGNKGDTPCGVFSKG